MLFHERGCFEQLQTRLTPKFTLILLFYVRLDSLCQLTTNCQYEFDEENEDENSLIIFLATIFASVYAVFV